LDRRV
jgi:hypothetical protein